MTGGHPDLLATPPAPRIESGAASRLEFLQALAHPVRWGLLTALARSDRKVGELVEQVDQPGNAVSYHLSRLRAAGLVRCRHSSADARDTYYTLELDRIRDGLAGTAESLLPASGHRLGGREDGVRGERQRPRVLFLCIHNDARSQMAEVMLRRLGAGRVDAQSAGTEPRSVATLALRALDDGGFEATGLRSKPAEELGGDRFDYVVSLCDVVRERPPRCFGSAEWIHWSLPDPAAVEDPESARIEAFRSLRAELAARLHQFLARIDGDRVRRFP